MHNFQEKIRALIVDDEPLARRGIRRQLKTSAPDVEIVGEAGNGREAVAAIEQLTPDLVFLDIQMPLLNGFSVVEKIRKLRLLPEIVFVTAFDEHALHAFEINALDYLLKPIDAARFEKTIERVRDRIKNSAAASSAEFERKFAALIEKLEPSVAAAAAQQKENYLKRIAVRNAGRVIFLHVSEIQWISSEGNYVCLHTVGGERHFLRETMDKLEAKLDPRDFLRLRRSSIVGVAQIKEMRQLFNGEFEVVLKTGVKLSTSRRYRKNLDALLKT